MDRKIILPLIGVIALLLAAALLLPGGRSADQSPKLPWQITLDDAGRVEVFGLTLGLSTLDDARTLLQQQGEVTLFQSPAGDYAAEAFFQRASVSGLRADFVFTLNVAPAQAAAMFERGLRLSKLGSGSRKVELSPADLTTLGRTALAHFTYVPGSDLDPELIRRQFGEPRQVIAEADGISHWLYPERGLDIAVNPDGKELFQYLPPEQFHQALQPLLQHATH